MTKQISLSGIAIRWPQKIISWKAIVHPNTRDTEPQFALVSLPHSSSEPALSYRHPAALPDPPTLAAPERALGTGSRMDVRNSPRHTNSIRCIRRSQSLPPPAAQCPLYKDNGLEDLDTMPEVLEALHVNATLYAKGYRYERI
ncbi:hypothetical protein R3P38DRAFT_3191457 [Favolaschia claudopus]|uniref:Uncharacterized protein n=1 Tax=Favolaschia claudopus TaxID=2862362 RepID=A0AAW0BL74_9AGAR